MLFDAHPQPGGMLRYGIPAFRLPRQVLDAEIQMIRNLGAEFRLGKRWGGTSRWTTCGGTSTRCSSRSARRARAAWAAPAKSWPRPHWSFSKSSPMARRRLSGSDVIVVGGGNTAMDACRCAVRLGAKSVRVLYRRTRREMPCLMEEVEAAEAEGVKIEFLVAPVRLERKAGKLSLTCQRMELGPPDAKRARQPGADPRLGIRGAGHVRHRGHWAERGLDAP